MERDTGILSDTTYPCFGRFFALFFEFYDLEYKPILEGGFFLLLAFGFLKHSNVLCFDNSMEGAAQVVKGGFSSGVTRIFFCTITTVAFECIS